MMPPKTIRSQLIKKTKEYFQEAFNCNLLFIKFTEFMLLFIELRNYLKAQYYYI